MKTSVQYSNKEAIANALILHLPKGGLVLDGTWGKGNFWDRNLKCPKIKLVRQDKHTRARVMACSTRMPYADGIFDCVILDPPYMQYGSTAMGHDSDRYGVRNAGKEHKGEPLRVFCILDTYYGMMVDSLRVIKHGGTLLVKCQDTSSSSINRWNHTEENQRISRKNYSYLWVLKKLPPREGVGWEVKG